jgi:hypothetical protein
MKKQDGGFAPPPFVMAKFVQNAAALIPASFIAGVRLFQNSKKHKKHSHSKTSISRKYNKKKKSIRKHNKK